MSKEKITKVWKVTNLSARSCVAHQFRVWYKKNEWTVPKFGKLFAFKTYSNAYDWLMNMGYPTDYTILLCDAVVCDDLLDIEYIANPFDSDAVERYWKVVENLGSDVVSSVTKVNDFGFNRHIPEGTVLCDKIKRLREEDVCYE